MILLLDIGNTHTHLGLANRKGVLRQKNISTTSWFNQTGAVRIKKFVGKTSIEGAVFCSVVPRANIHCRRHLQTVTSRAIQLTHRNIVGVGIDYPKPQSIGADRLANAVAVKHLFGAPAVVVDFGTAVTFDVVNSGGNYVGGIIAPGLSAMTDYLHEKTALLPRIRIREPKGIVGKNTEQAMLIGAVHGYRGLIQGLIRELKTELGVRRLPVVATGGYAELIAKKLPEITAIQPQLTLEGLRLLFMSTFFGNNCSDC